jgi:hypothetical protein
MVHLVSSRPPGWCCHPAAPRRRSPGPRCRAGRWRRRCRRRPSSGCWHRCRRRRCCASLGAAAWPRGWSPWALRRQGAGMRESGGGRHPGTWRPRCRCASGREPAVPASRAAKDRMRLPAAAGGRAAPASHSRSAAPQRAGRLTQHRRPEAAQAEHRAAGRGMLPRQLRPVELDGHGRAAHDELTLQPQARLICARGFAHRSASFDAGWQLRPRWRGGAARAVLPRDLALRAGPARTARGGATRPTFARAAGGRGGAAGGGGPARQLLRWRVTA